MCGICALNFIRVLNAIVFRKGAVWHDHVLLRCSERRPSRIGKQGINEIKAHGSHRSPEQQKSLWNHIQNVLTMLNKDIKRYVEH